MEALGLRASIVPDHGSTALGVTYIGFGIKIPTNSGLIQH